MSRLSKQSIRALCVPGHGLDGDTVPMIHPFEPDKVRVQGVSKGLSHASYDASIAHDLVLGRHPGYVIKEWALGLKFGQGIYNPDGSGFRLWLAAGRNLYNLLRNLHELQQRLRDEPPAYALAHTVEDFCMPANVAGDVADKSTFARVFVSAYNTFFDPGFHGNATLELVNDSDKRVEYKAGQGVCQFIFTWLDEATESPYDGKYQGQAKGAQAARFEADAPAVPPAQDSIVGSFEARARAAAVAGNEAEVAAIQEEARSHYRAVARPGTVGQGIPLPENKDGDLELELLGKAMERARLQGDSPLYRELYRNYINRHLQNTENALRAAEGLAPLDSVGYAVELDQRGARMLAGLVASDETPQQRRESMRETLRRHGLPREASVQTPLGTAVVTYADLNEAITRALSHQQLQAEQRSADRLRRTEDRCTDQYGANWNGGRS